MNRQRLLVIGGLVLVAFVAVVIYAITRPATKQPPSNSSATATPAQVSQTPNLAIITTPDFISADPNPNDSITTSSIYMVNITFSKIMTAASDIRVTLNGRDVTVGKTQFINGGIDLHVSVEPWQIGTYQVDYLACPATTPNDCRQGRYSFTVD